MYARNASFLCTTILALLAGCGAEGEPDPGPASIVSVSPSAIDLVTDQELEAVHVIVRTSADPRDAGQLFCATSSGVDFTVAYISVYWPPGLPVGSTLDPTVWEVTFEPDPNLSVEEHTGFLEVFLSSDPECALRDGASQRVPYRVSRIHGFAQPASVTIRIETETTADQLRGSARIDMAGGPQHAWTALSLSPWLVVDTSQGLTGGDVQFHVDPTWVASLLANRRSALGEIEISGDTEGMTSRKVAVVLQFALPVARSAIPPDHPAGPPRQFRVRGEGFTEELLAHAPLVVEAVPDAVFTRLSSTELMVELPAALPAGTYEVVTPNALGLSPSSAVLRLTAPLEAARTVLPGSGAGGRMIWDGARSALMVLEPPPTTSLQYSTTLRRHAFRDGVWTTITKPVNRLRRMGLSPDGTKLLATSDDPDYGLYAFDPERLSVVGMGSYLTPPYEPPSQAPLAVTFDGRVWAGMVNRLMTFDTGNYYRQTMVSPTAWSRDDHRPAQTIAARDGSRLLVSRPGSRAFLSHDATEPLRDDAFHANPAGATTADAISDDGSRVLSGTSVYDGSFALLGTLPAPAILSGDGRRAFTLEFRSHVSVGGPAPLVHVFDLTAPAEGGGPLPELGTVDLLDHATCAAGERTCAPSSSMVVTHDGRVLFVQTDGGVVVVPIPESLAGP
jgi:hypothetical protein